jgi:hypothetical protein
MRPHEDVPNRDTRGVEAPTDADDTRQAVAPRHFQNHAVAGAKRRAEALSWSMALTEIDSILDHHSTEKAGKMLWWAGGPSLMGAWREQGYLSRGAASCGLASSRGFKDRNRIV